MWVCLQPTCCPDRSSPWVSRRCLLGLRSGKEQQVGGGRLEAEGLWDPQEMGAGGRVGCQGCSAPELAVRLEDWGSWGAEGSEVCCSLPGFLADVACDLARDACWSWRLFPGLLSWCVFNEYLLFLESWDNEMCQGKEGLERRSF